MPERIVSDHERVTSCRALLESRFPDRYPTVEDVMRVTGLPRDRVLVAKPPERHPNAPCAAVRVESLPCVKCGGRFDHPIGRGRKPHRCLNCR